MIKNINQIITYYRLGGLNLIRVGLYRVLLKLGLHSVQKIEKKSINGPFFCVQDPTLLNNNDGLPSYEVLRKGFHPFSGCYISFDNDTPNWHKNYFNNHESSFKNIDWWKIPDFDIQLGDIKTVWELSRFGWVVQLSIIASTGDKRALDLLNERLNSWIQENQFYKGVNWKCGQEASIRVMHLILAAIILNQLESPLKSLIDLIEIHIKRIAPTISYAIGQDNNHGTSEAAALFVGGHFLTLQGLNHYKKYELIGKGWLEDRARKLFSDDGCLSQYSVNYQRLALDTYSFCETYRRINILAPFSNALYNKIKKATHWLEILTDSKTGDAPNIGANDGARIFNMFNFDYRDFRNSVQWANLIFNNRFIYSITENQHKIYNQLGIIVKSAWKDNPIQEALLMGNDDGFFIYRKSDLLLVFKRPFFKFRPSHSDALHVDLWIGGKNILRDGWSYSYNTTTEKSSYYCGVASHNSIQFDSRDQMPKVGRFLFGSWLKEIEFHCDSSKHSFMISAAYRDYLDSFHKRELFISSNKVIVKDQYSGIKQNAQLKWRLNPNQFKFDSGISKKNEINIDITSRIITGDFNLSAEFESRFYLTESSLPVISNTLNRSGNFITNITWE